MMEYLVEKEKIFIVLCGEMMERSLVVKGESDVYNAMW